MKKLMMVLGLVVLFAGSANVFAKTAAQVAAEKSFARYTEMVNIVKEPNVMSPKSMSVIELCHLGRFIVNINDGLDNYIKNITGAKRALLSDFRSYIEELKNNQDDYLLGLKGEIITRIKAINKNASCLKDLQ